MAGLSRRGRAKTGKAASQANQRKVTAKPEEVVAQPVKTGKKA